MIFHIGLDDTDSEEGMCTTYVGAVIRDELKEIGIESVDYPHLIRLNPNWKWKTRGNCAVSLILDVKENEIPKVKRIALEKVEELAELQIEETTPGVAFYQGEDIPEKLKNFSKKVIQKVATLEEAEKVAEEVGADYEKFREGRGIIGALAAIGHTLKEDYTYELIPYREEQNRGEPRRLDDDSVWKMDKLTYPSTFDNVDPEAGEVSIAPHTPCPILYGIRSESPDDAFEAREIVTEEEPVERMALFKTNQGTDEHLQSKSIEEIEPYESVIVEGTVLDSPVTIDGGHVFFSIEDQGYEMRCSAFEPTREFRKVIRELVEGDKVKVFGGVKEKEEHPLTINLEKIEILDLTPVKEEVNPRCGGCGKRMKSAGQEKGYYCEKCGTRLPSGSSEKIEKNREIEERLYEVPPRARRHLAKPMVRDRNQENS
mgnify:CR=1 FL=1